MKKLFLQVFIIFLVTAISISSLIYPAIFAFDTVSEIQYMHATTVDSSWTFTGAYDGAIVVVFNDRDELHTVTAPNASFAYEMRSTSPSDESFVQRTYTYYAYVTAGEYTVSVTGARSSAGTLENVTYYYFPGVHSLRTAYYGAEDAAEASYYFDFATINSKYLCVMASPNLVGNNSSFVYKSCSAPAEYNGRYLSTWVLDGTLGTNFSAVARTGNSHFVAIELSPDPPPDPEEDDDQGILDTLRSVFSKITHLPQAIYEGFSSAIENIGSTLIALKDAVLGLPETICNGFKTLFIPSNGFMDGMFTSARGLVEAKWNCQ